MIRIETRARAHSDFEMTAADRCPLAWVQSRLDSYDLVGLSAANTQSRNHVVADFRTGSAAREIRGLRLHNEDATVYPAWKVAKTHG